MSLRIGLGALVMCFTSATALAADTPKVPATAKKLDAAGIKDHYSGLHATFNNVSQKASLTGEVWYDIENGKSWGMYVWDAKNKGVFKSKIRVKADQFCYKSDGDKKETCVDVYRDGKTYYETDANKKVSSVDQVLDAAAPDVPTSAKKATAEEIGAWANGKSVFVTVYDADKPLVALSKWDWKKKRVSGEYVEDGKKKGKFQIKFTVKDDTICFKDRGDTPNCYSYHLDGNTFYETTVDGKLHAKSVLP